jgi:hypothetical protein
MRASKNFIAAYAMGEHGLSPDTTTSTSRHDNVKSEVHLSVLSVGTLDGISCYKIGLSGFEVDYATVAGIPKCAVRTNML